jgi:hypothetical protein
MDSTTIAIDVAKSVFEVAVSDRPGHDVPSFFRAVRPSALQTRGEQRRFVPGIPRANVPRGQTPHRARIEALHQLDIQLAVPPRCRQDVGDRIADPRVVQHGAELVEGVEDVLMSLQQRPLKFLHRPGAKHAVVEDRIGERAGQGDLTLATRRRRSRERRRADTHPVLRSPFDQALALHGPGQMTVEISAFRHLLEQCSQRPVALAHPLQSPVDSFLTGPDLRSPRGLLSPTGIAADEQESADDGIHERRHAA